MPYYVYILSNVRRTVLYTGITSDLRRRLAAHRRGEGSVFTHRYRCHDLIYVEEHARVTDAIQRETEIKSWRREKKLALIRHLNPALASYDY
jgi:putative endonuclease